MKDQLKRDSADQLTLKLFLVYDQDSVPDNLHDLGNVSDSLFDLDNVYDNLYYLGNVFDNLYD